MERKIKLQITGMEKKYKNGDGVENINIDVYEGDHAGSIRLWKIHDTENFGRIFGH